MLKARKLNDLINAKAATQDLSDSELMHEAEESASIVGDVDADGDIEEVPPPVPAMPPQAATSTAVVTARTVRNLPIERPAESSVDRRSARSSTAADTMRSIVRAFDPSTQRARDQERGERLTTSTQILAMSQQLRDVQSVNESLRRDLNDVRDRLRESERAKDLAEMRLDIERKVNPALHSGRRHSRSRSRSYDRYSHHYSPARSTPFPPLSLFTLSVTRRFRSSQSSTTRR